LGGDGVGKGCRVVASVVAGVEEDECEDGDGKGRRRKSRTT
jgi:hypothetical protein